jgi:hypothetical protein
VYEEGIEDNVMLWIEKIYCINVIAKNVHLTENNDLILEDIKSNIIPKYEINVEKLTKKVY